MTTVQPSTFERTSARSPQSSGMTQLRADGISRSYGDRRVLTDVSLTVAPGARIGVIGENGAGKSTLLRILAGVEAPDAGRALRPRRTGLLWQEVQFAPDDTLDALLERALAEARGIEAELADAAAALADTSVPAADRDPADRYAAALAAAEQAEVWSADARRDELLDGLGVGDIPLDRRLAEVSGGQRSRFALAALLLERPDALLLDEPTNHLDDEAAAFLERQLRAWSGPVLFASHDRSFLDAVATGLLDLDPARAPLGAVSASATSAGASATSFGGSYTDYLAAKAAERERWERQFAAEQDELKQLKLAVDVTARSLAHGAGPRDNDKFIYAFKGGRVDGQISRRVKNARGRLEDLRASQVRKPPAPLRFAGIPHGSHTLEAGLLLQATDARVASRLDIARFSVEPASRILVTGANGAGKSTLLAALAGTLELNAGTIARRRGLRIGLLEQDVRFADPDASARRIYEQTLGERRAEATPLSGLGLLAPRDLDRPVGALSIGQQRRLALALIIARPPHVFLLDEPTNHLSLSLAEELEDALGSYPGAIVVASHDRWLRAHWQGESIHLENGSVVGG